MKGTLFIVLFVLMLKPAWPVLEYVINYDYIVKELCVNRTRPQMHCNGKCHLMKELAKAAEEQKQESDRKSVQQQAEVLFVQALPVFYFTTVTVAAPQKKHIPYQNNYSYLYNNAVHHPPSVIS